MDAPHLPVVFAQVSEATAAADGLQKGGAYFICAVLGYFLWEQIKENRALSQRMLDMSEKHKEAQVALLKENMPLVYKVTEAVRELAKVADSLTED